MFMIVVFQLTTGYIFLQENFTHFDTIYIVL